jgi:phage baseplate assembly protein gpV
VFIPSVLANYTIDSDDADNMVIQNLDGTVKISLGTDSVSITTPTEVTITSPLTTITGELVVQGLLRSTGGFASTGIATNIYSTYIGGSMYVLQNGDSGIAFNPGVPGSPVPPPTPP